MLTCLIDGKLCSADEARIPVDDHGLLYGDGVFEGLRFYNRHAFRSRAHLARLASSARALGISLPYTAQELEDHMELAISSSGLASGYIRLLVTRGSGPLGIDPSRCHNPRTIVMVGELVMVDPEKRVHGIDAIIASIRRLGTDQLDPRIKSLNYLNQIMARLEASAADADEAIMLNRDGRVAEGTADNVFIVRAGRLLTPPVLEGALDGITRGVILELAEGLGIEVSEEPLAPMDLFVADECFVTGTGAELIPVRTISGRPVGGRGPVFERLSSAFAQLIAEETTDRYAQFA